MNERGALVLVILLLLAGCVPTMNLRNFCSFPVRSIEDAPLLEGLICPEEVSQSGIRDLWRFEVWDTLVVYYKKMMGEAMYHVAGMRGGEDYGHFCRRGRGAGEVLVTNPSFQIIGDNVIVFDLMNGHYYELDLKSSMDSGRTEYARQVQLKDYSGRTFQHPRSVSGDRVLLFDSATIAEGNRLSRTPCFSLYDLRTGELIRDYQCFQNIPLTQKRGSEWLPQELLAMNVCVDSVGRRACFVMNMFPMVGFIDMATDSIKGVWIKGKQKFSEKSKPFIHFLGCETDGERIFALYQGVFSGENEEESPSELYVFDWNGSILGRYLLDRRFYWLSVRNHTLFLQYSDYRNEEWEARICSLNINSMETRNQNS